MAHDAKLLDITTERRRLEELGPRTMFAGIALGALLIGLSGLFPWLVQEIGVRGWWFGYLIGACFVLSLSLGGLFFTLMLHVTGAGWGIVTRRLAEGMAMTMPFVLLLFCPIFFKGFSTIYEMWNWTITRSTPKQA